MGPIQTLGDITDMLRRRAVMIIMLIALGAAASVIFALNQPHRFVSTEVIQIERPRITSDLAPTTVEGSSARRLQQIEQKLMARDTILGIINEFGVFADMPALSGLEKVALFRKSVTIEGVAAAREGMADDGTVAALTITAMLGSPELAQAVVSELGARTILLSNEARQAKTLAALEFFTTEERALIEAIATLETELSGFRSQNELAISGGIEARQEQIGAIEQALLAVEQRRIAVQQEIDQVATGSQRSATLRRVAELNRQIDSLNEQQAFLTTRRDQVQESLSGAPEVERQVDILQMRLEQYQEQLAGISARRVDAEIGQRLEADRQAERLEVLEPASLPEEPAEPSRRKIAALGTLGSIMAALCLAVILDIRHPVIRTAAQMQRELGFVPAISIPFQKPKRRVRKPLVVRFGTAIWRPVGRFVSAIFSGVRWAEDRAASALSRIGANRRAS